MILDQLVAVVGGLFVPGVPTEERRQIARIRLDLYDAALGRTR